MAKVLKAIANILLVIFIVVAAAQLVPPLVGVTTVVATPDVTSNMQEGSVAYGWRKSLTTLSAGDQIVYSNDKVAYVYEIVELDASTGEVTVRTSENSSTDVLKLRKTASKKLLVIPYIGYMTIAMQSSEGKIILLLIIAVIIVLMIISSVMSRRILEDEEEEEEDQYFRDLASSYNKPHELDKLRNPSVSEGTASAGATTHTLMEFEPINVAEVMDKEEMDATRVYTTGSVQQPQNIQEQASGELTDEEQIALARMELRQESREEAPVPETPVIPEEPEEKPILQPQPQEPGHKGNTEEIELAIPVRTLEEIMQQAYSAGLDPLVTKDSVTGIDFVDFSDCL